MPRRTRVCPRRSRGSVLAWSAWSSLIGRDPPALEHQLAEPTGRQTIGDGHQRAPRGGFGIGAEAEEALLQRRALLDVVEVGKGGLEPDEPALDQLDQRVVHGHHVLAQAGRDDVRAPGAPCRRGSGWRSPGSRTSSRAPRPGRGRRRAGAAPARRPRCSVSASCERICDCWCGGNESMMRMTVCAADCVAMVEITRLPVSAAVSAIAMLVRSRISPTKMMCGSWRSAPLSPRA